MTELTLDDIKVNPLFKNLLPPLTDEEFHDLEKDIVMRKKILNPILVWSKGNFIIDGHNRYRILVDNNIHTDNIEIMDFDTESEVMTWIVDSQFAKRNLTRSQKVILLQKIEEQVRKEAAMRVGGRPRKEGEKPESNLTQVSNHLETGRTAEIMAKKMGVSKNTYKDMKLIVDKGSQEKIDRMNKGGQGNGVSRIASEIRNHVPDGYRQCSHCGEIKPIEEMSPGKNCYFCKTCSTQIRAENKRKQEKQESQYDYAPRDDYYNVDAVPTWTYEEIQKMAKSVFDNTVLQLKQLFNHHKEDVFRNTAHIEKYADEMQKFASEIKFVEMEIRHYAPNSKK